MEKMFPSNRTEFGPFDSSEVNLPIGFVDFGSIRLVHTPDLAIRLEVDEATGNVVALTIEAHNSVLQVSAFAASKDEGLWFDVLTQLKDSITAAGGQVDEVLTQLGTTLLTSVPQADGSIRNIRFIGVDGPRWFIRGSITGAAVTDPVANTEIEDVFRSLVIHRGDAPMPPREPLPILVPAGVVLPPRPSR